MNKAFENIIDELKQESIIVDDDAGHRAVEIIEQIAEEYNNGWIACSDRLPDDFMSMEYLTTVNGHFYPEINYYCVANHKWFSSRKTTKEVDVIAWQPLPEPFKERD